MTAMIHFIFWSPHMACSFISKTLCECTAIRHTTTACKPHAHAHTHLSTTKFPQVSIIYRDKTAKTQRNVLKYRWIHTKWEAIAKCKSHLSRVPRGCSWYSHRLQHFCMKWLLSRLHPWTCKTHLELASQCFYHCTAQWFPYLTNMIKKIHQSKKEKNFPNNGQVQGNFW